MVMYSWMYESSIIKVLQQIKKTSPFGVTRLITMDCGEGFGANPNWRPTPPFAFRRFMS